jgi:hypothetical protein
MKLSVIYRSTGPESGPTRPDTGKARPAHFSKLVSLLSFLRSMESSKELDQVVFLNDGPMPNDRLELMAASGEIVNLPGLGKSRSLRAALSLVDTRGWDDTDIVYLAEDDYLYQPESLTSLASAAKDIRQASYFSLYDYPGHYVSSTIDPGAERLVPRRLETHVFWAGGRHWRSSMSTTHSFAARVSALRQDSWVHWLGTRAAEPSDFAMWLASQGLGAYRLVHLIGKGRGIPTNRALARAALRALLSRRGFASRRLLISPMPSLATHLESKYLAPGIDWAYVAADTSKWARSRGLSLPTSPERTSA